MDVRPTLGERVRRRQMALGLNQTTFVDDRLVLVLVPDAPLERGGRSSCTTLPVSLVA